MRIGILKKKYHFSRDSQEFILIFTQGFVNLNRRSADTQLVDNLNSPFAPWRYEKGKDRDIVDKIEANGCLIG